MKTSIKIERPLIGMDEACKYLKVPKNTLYKLTAERKIPVTKYNGSNRFSPDLLDEWIKKNTEMSI